MAVLAPMVRLGTLPLRLLSIERGADIVYSEEIVAEKLARAERSVDERLGTIDWRAGGGIVLRTCDAERGRLVVQIGTADPQTALAAIAALEFDPSHPSRDGIIGVSGHPYVLNLSRTAQHATPAHD
jgi:tRNA-dihydrouridine synthase 2